jgi:hypothetical protein
MIVLRQNRLSTTPFVTDFVTNGAVGDVRLPEAEAVVVKLSIRPPR